MVYRNIYNRIEIIRDSKGKIIPLWSKIKYKHRNMLHLFRVTFLLTVGCLCICCSEQMLVPLFVYSSTHTGELMM